MVTSSRLSVAAPRVPAISVVIAAYGHARFIGQTLASVFAQTRPPAEVIVINDGSPDDTRGAVGPFLERITYLEQSNQGYVITMNRGLDLARGDYVFVFSSDDWLEPDAFETLGAVLDADAQIGLAYGSVSYADEEGRALDTPQWVRFPVGKHRDADALIRQCYIPGMAVLLRRAALDAVGGHVPDFEAHQDWALFLRVLFSGWHLHGTDKRIAFYRRHDDNMTDRTRRKQVYRDVLAIVDDLEATFAARLTGRDREALTARRRQAHRKVAWAALSEGDRATARRAFSALMRRQGDLRAGAGWLLSVLPPPVFSALVAADSYAMRTHRRASIRLKQWL